MQKMSCESVCRGFLLRRQSFRSRNIALTMDNSRSWFRNRGRSLSVSSKEESLDISLSDYDAFRRSLCGGSLKYKALFVDAAGTLIVPSQPAAKVFRKT